jgi:hypothetical protein
MSAFRVLLRLGLTGLLVYVALKHSRWIAASFERLMQPLEAFVSKHSGKLKESLSSCGATEQFSANIDLDHPNLNAPSALANLRMLNASVKRPDMDEPYVNFRATSELSLGPIPIDSPTIKTATFNRHLQHDQFRQPVVHGQKTFHSQQTNPANWHLDNPMNMAILSSRTAAAAGGVTSSDKSDASVVENV